MLRDNAAAPPVRSAVSRQPALPMAERALCRVLDLRGSPATGPLTMRWPAGHRVVVSGLPGSGKSTLMGRTTAPGGTVIRIDSQDVREHWARRLPRWLPYRAYRPAVRVTHYLRLWQALRSPASVIVHDCGSTAWVRRWLARDARRSERGFHLILLDVPAHAALAGQAQRGRMVSGYAFGKHRRAMARLVADVEAERLPRGCASATLLDGTVTGTVHQIVFTRSPVPAAGDIGAFTADGTGHAPEGTGRPAG